MTKAKRIAMLLIALVVAVCFTAEITLETANAAPKYYDYTCGFKYGCICFKVGKFKTEGTCCSPGKHSGGGKCTMKKLSQTNKYTRVTYYYVVEKKWWSKSSGKSQWVEFMVQNMNERSKFKNVRGSAIQNKTDHYIDVALQKVKKAPDWYYCYRMTPKDGSKQSSIQWKNCPCKVTIKKALAKTSPSAAGLKAYKKPHYKGIQYGLYSGSGCSDSQLLGKWYIGKTGTVQKVYIRNWVGSKKWKWTSKTKYITVKKRSKKYYYIKEIKTNSYFKKSDKVYGPYKFNKKKHKKTFKDKPNPCYVKAKKTISGGASTTTTFPIVLQSVEKPKLKYTLEPKGNGTWTTPKKILAGKYKVTEKLPSNSKYKFVSMKINGENTKTFTAKLTGRNKNTTEATAIEIEVVNTELPSGPVLTVQKKVTTPNDDEVDLSGFQFKVTGDLENWGEITTSDINNLSDPPSPSWATSGCSWGSWQINASQVANINNAARAGLTGTYSVSATISGTGYYRVSTASGGWTTRSSSCYDSETIYVNLLPSQYDKPNYRYDRDNDITGSETSYTFYGSKTPYVDYITNDTTTNFVSDDKGQGVNSANTSIRYARIPIEKGTYTLTEVLTPEQAKVFRVVSPNPQTITKAEGDIDVMFEVVNEAKPTTVRVKKVSDGTEPNATELDFKLTGTDIFGNEIEMEGTTQIPDSGEDDDEASEGVSPPAYFEFTGLYPGTYVIEEVGFNPVLYTNNHPLDGYENPAQRFTIPDTNTPQELEFTFNNTMSIPPCPSRKDFSRFT